MTIKRLLYAILALILLVTPWRGGTGLTLLFALVPLLLLQLDLEPDRTLRRAQKAKLKGLSKPERKKARKNLLPKGHIPLWVYIAVIFAIWWLATTWWVGKASLVGAVLAVVFGSALCTGAFMLYDLVWRKAPKALAYTVLVTAWISYELLYINGELSFPWLTLGGGFANDVMLIQWYEFTGILGGSLWVLVCNLLIFESVLKSKRMKEISKSALPGHTFRKNIASLIIAVSVVIIPIAVSLVIYFNYREPDRKVSVKVIQPNLDPYSEKFLTSDQTQSNLFQSLMRQGKQNVDFIILPETAIDSDSDYIYENEPLKNPSVAQLYELMMNESPASTLVIGATTITRYSDQSSASVTARPAGYGTYYDVYNTAIYLDSEAAPAYHHKSILVAGAEKMPFYRLTKHLDFLVLELGGTSGQLGVDSVRTVFCTQSGVTGATAICYESIYGQYYSEFVRNGAQIMFVITNDGWWGNTSGHRNHFAYSRLRAIETRRSIARSANTGISGFINQRGDVTGKLGWNVRGVIDGELSLNDRITLYTRYGDVVGRLSVYVLVLSLLFFLAYRFKLRNHLME